MKMAVRDLEGRNFKLNQLDKCESIEKEGENVF